MLSLPRFVRASFAAVVAASWIACSPSPADPVPVTDLAASDQDAIRSAPESVSADGTELSLAVYVWRNGMPGSDDHGLILSTTLVASSPKMPAGVVLERPIVVLGTQAWAPGYTDESPPNEPNRLERLARNGPNWTTPSVVDVVVRVDDGGHVLYLAKRGVKIERPE